MGRIERVALATSLILFVTFFGALTLPVLLVFIGVYILAVVFGTISQLTYQRKSIQEIKIGFKQTLLKSLVLVIVMMISSLIWNYMGWRGGQPIHLPWQSNSLTTGVSDR